MLDPEFLGDLPDSVVDMWHAVETDLLCDIAKRINNSNYLIPTSVWNLNKLKDIGLHQDYIEQKLAEATKKSKEEIVKIMADAFRQGLRHDNEIIKRGLGKLDDIVINAKAFNPIASAGIKAVNNEIKNFTKTYAARLSQKYEWSIDKAFLNVQSGYMTPEQATKRAIEELFLHNDLPDLVTKNGRHEQLSTVVSRAIRTGTNQTMAKIQIANCKDLECDLVEVSSHYGARPTHVEWQGQIYSLSGKSNKYPDFIKSTGYGGIDGLCGINCRHSFYPYFEGLSSKSFDRIDFKENQKYYELKNKERQLNNKVKHLTKKAKVLKAGEVGTYSVERELKIVKAIKSKVDDGLKIASFMNKTKEKIVTSNNLLNKEWVIEEGINSTISQKIVDEINKGVNIVLKELPELNEYLTSIELVESNKFYMATGTSLENGKLLSSLYISNTFFKLDNIIQEKLKRDKKMKHLAEWTDVYTLPLHEAGHLIESVIVDKNYPSDMKIKVLQERIVAKNILKQASKNTNLNLYKELENIGKYAFENNSEKLAELIHKELSGNGNIFTAEVLKICRNLMK